ncbi:MAG TPA: tetratricopeptide repeat protein, partial [Stellaceae bacterium]|nr:tetratricopeptide repeat protein [Stellaceae bacterium]
MASGRNDPCPCGSGRKYKRCCGVAGRSHAASLRPAGGAPAAAGAANNLGLVHLRSGRLTDAIGCFERAIALAPDLAVGHYNLGTALQRQGDDRPAIAALRRAVALAPRLADAHERLGNLLMAHGGAAEAVDCFRRAAAAAPNSTLGRLNRAKALHHEGKRAEAETVLRQAVALDPASAPLRFFLGHVLGETGRFDESMASLERAIELDPRLARAYHSLCQSKRIGDADQPLMARMLALLDDPVVVGKDLVDLHFALGKAFDDLSDYERAMHHYDAGNRLVRRGVVFDRAQFAVGVNRLIASFTPEFFDAHRGLGSDRQTPVLILGMMRSGTTLVEQILSNHSQV